MKKYICVCLLAILFAGCDDRLQDLNTDKKNPESVSPESLFAAATREVVDNVYSISVNDNPFRLYSQMWAQTTYPDESQYAMTTREIPYGIFVNQYRDVLADLNESKRLIQKSIDENTSLEPSEALQNKLAILDILMGYTYTTLVDIFGDVPYTEALDILNLTPAYDDAATIYNSVEGKLTAASTVLTTAANASSYGFESSDLVYGDDLAAWAKFANSVKLRMAMKLADVDAATSIAWANEAMAAGVFESNADNFSMDYQSSSPNTSPLYEDLILSGRKDFVLANTLVDEMNSLLDPRLLVYGRKPISYGWNAAEDGSAQDSTFTSNVILEYYDADGKMTSRDYVDVAITPLTLLAADSTATGDLRIYKGGVYGGANNYGGSSQVGDILEDPTYPGILFAYTEIEFLMAEMVERGGYTIPDGGTAEEHYNAAITASFDQWGVADVATYLTRTNVAYATATGDWKQKIGTQMWLGLYNQGLEAWSTWRRLDFLGFVAPPDMEMTDIPVRMTYPLREATLNGPNYEAAGAKIGGNKASTKLFWDVN